MGGISIGHSWMICYKRVSSSIFPLICDKYLVKTKHWMCSRNENKAKQKKTYLNDLLPTKYITANRLSIIGPTNRTNKKSFHSLQKDWHKQFTIGRCMMSLSHLLIMSCIVLSWFIAQLRLKIQILSQMTYFF